MTRNVTALVAGALFGAGLIVSGMTNPARVRGFLDVLGQWDATLAWVMVGAIGVNAVLLRRIVRLERPWHDDRFHLPTRADFDPPLLWGAALFGIGWGLGGYCPGPALVSAGAWSSTALWFVPAMLGGMWLHDRVRPPTR